MRKAELLAPAGDFDSLVAAVQNGADAVYFGGSMFNARRSADNFDEEELRRAVEYAHLYNVKVYITFNILIKEEELEDATEFLGLLDEVNVDAVIVQDIGLVKLIRDKYPRLRIHASTQMTVHNLEGLRALEDMGVSRAILAREVTLREIQNMTSKSSMELETFVHGALCICYSGQCLMSSMIGGRSGNRGMCAQPCRLPYELIDEKGSIIKDRAHLLSPKDLCSYDFLYNIIDAGVTSLKIEGRMKRPEYVGIITRAYRELIDSAVPSQSRRQELLQIFNRGGFTTGYYFGMDNRDIICTEKPNNWGVYIGEVAQSFGNSIKVLLEEDLAIGDGIEFWVEGGSNWGQTVDTIEFDNHRIDRGYKGQDIVLSTKRRVDLGTKIYRTSSVALLEDIRASFKSPYETRKIGVIIEADLAVGEKPSIIIRDERGLEGRVVGDSPVEQAKTSPLSANEVKAQLERLGGTPFLSVDTRVHMDENIFMPKSVINKLRRQAVNELIKERIESFEYDREKTIPKVKIHETFRTPKPSNNSEEQRSILMLYTDNLNLDERVLKNIDGICLCPTKWRDLDIEEIRRGVERYKGYNKSTRLVLQRILHEDDMALIRSLDPLIWNIFHSYQGGNLGTIYLLKAMGVHEIVGDFSLNITNSYSLELLRGMGVDMAVLSPELTIGELGGIIRRSNIDCEILVHGHLPLMIMQYCPTGGSRKSCSYCRIDEGVFLKDRKDMEFPLMRIELTNCYSQILNCHPLFTAHQLHRIIGLDAKYLGLYGLYSHEDLEMVTGLYRYAIDNIDMGDSKYIEDAIEHIISRGYTNGHFFRGVY